MMKDISLEAGLSQIYTNHCIRAPTATMLGHAGVAPRLICAVTGHKNEQSLAHYIQDVTIDQRKHMSAILSNEPTANAVMPHQAAATNMTVATPGQPSNSNTSTTNTSMQRYATMFSGANFYGTVNIKFD